MPTRTFIALDIDQASRDDLADLAGRIDVGEAKVNWVAAENLHVTLNFLGEVADDLLAKVCNLVAEVAAGVESFDFRLRGVLAVPPSGRQLRMFWIGVDDPTGRLVQLQENLRQALDGMGFRREDRSYRPHITLARVKFARDAQALRRAAAPLAGEDFGLQRAAEAVVYGSVLSADGPTYTPIARAKLGG